MANAQTWLDRLLTKLISVAGIQQPNRGTLDFAAGFTTTDDPANDITHITAVGTAGAPDQTNLTLANGANQNIDPASKTVLRISGPTAAFSIGGFVAPANPATLVIFNTTSEPLTFQHEDIGSIAANRIQTPTNAAITLPPRHGKVSLTYDTTAKRWILGELGYRRPFSFDVREDFGAVGDGVTDDTAAIQAAVTAAIGSGITGARVQFPTANGQYYKITSPITGTSSDGLVLEGVGGQAYLVWVGGAYTANQAMLSFSGAHRMHIKNLTLQANTALDIGIDLYVTSLSDTWVASQCLIEHCYFSSGPARLERCIAIGAHGNDANNDFHRVVNCRFEGYGNRAVDIVGTESYGNDFTNCVAIGGFSTTHGSIPNGSFTLTTDTANIFLSSRDVGKYIEVVDGSGNRLRTTISAVPTTTTVTLATSWSFPTIPPGSPSAGIITYGSQRGLSVVGSCRWVGGSLSEHLDCDLFIDGQNDGAIIVDGAVCESSRRFLVTGGPSGGVTKMVSLRGIRWSGDGMVPEDTQGIRYVLAGDLVADNCHFVDPGISPPLFQIGLTSGNEFTKHIFRDCTFNTSASPVNLFISQFPAEMQGINRIITNTGATMFGQLDYHGLAGSGTIHLNAGLGTVQKVLLSNDATFVFDQLVTGVGSTFWLVIKDNAGPHLYTWPSVTWEDGFIPAQSVAGQTDFFEFRYDGTTVFGRMVRTDASVERGPNRVLATNASISVSTGTVTLNQIQYSAAILTLSGVLSGNVTIVLPNVAGLWDVDVSGVTLGAFGIAFQSGSATSASLTSTVLTTTSQLIRVRTTGSNGVAVNS